VVASKRTFLIIRREVFGTYIHNFFVRLEAVTETSLKMESLWEGEDMSADK
jgi:hypothetical protein